MDWERLEQFVLRCPLQELVFRNEVDIYALGNDCTKPAWWDVTHATVGESGTKTYRTRGLKDMVNLTEQVYPDFYSWLLARFSAE